MTWMETKVWQGDESAPDRYDKTVSVCKFQTPSTFLNFQSESIIAGLNTHKRHIEQKGYFIWSSKCPWDQNCQFFLSPGDNLFTTNSMLTGKIHLLKLSCVYFHMLSIFGWFPLLSCSKITHKAWMRTGAVPSLSAWWETFFLCRDFLIIKQEE